MDLFRSERFASSTALDIGTGQGSTAAALAVNFGIVLATETHWDLDMGGLLGSDGSKASLPINIPHGWQGNGMFHGCNRTISEKSGHSINRNGHFTDGNGDLRIKTGTWTRVKIYIIATLFDVNYIQATWVCPWGYYPHGYSKGRK